MDNEDFLNMMIHAVYLMDADVEYWHYKKADRCSFEIILWGGKPPHFFTHTIPSFVTQSSHRRALIDTENARDEE